MRIARVMVLVLMLVPGLAAHTATTKHPRETTVAILMFDGVQIIDFAAPYEVFGQAGFTVYTVSRDGKPVTTWMNLKTSVDHSFSSAPRADIVVIPGGHVHDAQQDPATLEWIRTAGAPAQHVMSICTGAFILGETGLLDGHAATTFHRSFDALERQFPKTTVVRDQRWVDSGHVVTSAGLASGVDASLHLVAQIRGMKAARSVAMTLEYDWSPQPQFVRGRMADRHIRLPVTMDIPEGTRIDRISSTGDARSWEEEFLVESALAPEALLARFREQASRDAALTLLASASPGQVGWQYESRSGGRWQLTVAAVEGATSGQYRLVEKLTPLD